MNQTIRVVCWNIDRRREPWRELDRMARQGEADVALLQEAGSPPGDSTRLMPHGDEEFRGRDLHDRWPAVVRLSDRVRIDRFRQVSPLGECAEGDIKVSDIGTLAAARITPIEHPDR
ncbi:MAG: hypothetical protein OXN16_10805 [Gammaproteobacteria bacterium]|nr:hypothetical protein [Gammaproteobacteria bacterium]